MDMQVTGYFEGEPGAQVPLPVARLRQRKSLKLMGPETQSLLAAALLASDRAGWDDTPQPGCGVCVSAPPPVFPTPVPPEAGPASAFPSAWPPLWLLGCLPNMAASHLAIQFQASGPCHTLATTNWDSLTGLARSWIENGEAARVIVAGRMADGRVRAAVLGGAPA